MNQEREPHVLRTPAAEHQAVEDRALDAALRDAASEIAESLRREEVQLMRQRRRTSMGWIPFVLIVLAGLFVAFLLPDRLEFLPQPVVKEQKVEQKVGDVVPAEKLDLSTGEFTLRLPRGFEWPVTLVALEEGRYQLTSIRNLNCAGIYVMNGQRLQMEVPVDRRLVEFQWLVEDGNHLRLVAEPPAAKTGAKYLGATLTRNLVDQP